MKLLLSLLLLITASSNCNVQTVPQSVKGEYALYSDYFVFIADDKDSPLVIPVDLNWNANDEGYDIEFKSWYGTQEEWPIVYTKEAYKNKSIPQESFQNKDISSFKFSKSKQEITLSIPNSPSVTLSIPAKETWVLAPSNNKINKETFAARTSVQVNNETQNGWMIYERIRWKKEQLTQFGAFDEFFWIPVIVNKDFYHFEQHKGEKAGFKWTVNDGDIEVSRVSDFELEITGTISDAKSGRKAVPKEVSISSKENNLNISLVSTGQQVGYGERFPKGLAYYRQSLLTSEKNNENSSVGMMELILEDN